MSQLPAPWKIVCRSMNCRRSRRQKPKQDSQVAGKGKGCVSSSLLHNAAKGLSQITKFGLAAGGLRSGFFALEWTNIRQKIPGKSGGARKKPVI
jgi:hypothetical protein